jgi:hypothetical protein
MQVMRINNLDRADKTDRGIDTTKAYRLARFCYGLAVRAEALRSSRLYRG